MSGSIVLFVKCVCGLLLCMSSVIGVIGVLGVCVGSVSVLMRWVLFVWNVSVDMVVFFSLKLDRLCSVSVFVVM